MKKDIPARKVTDLAIAIVPRTVNSLDEDLWDTYIINLKNESIHNVLISSKGYGKVKGKQFRTTTLRHFFEEIGPNRAVKIEPIQKKLFELNNEYWISFSLNDYMYDKKYIFVMGSITKQHFTPIPILDKPGVMIK